jgi:hypothetical protein
LFIASIGKTMTSKDGAKRTSDLVADASDTEAESVNLREVVDLVDEGDGNDRGYADVIEDICKSLRVPASHFVQFGVVDQGDDVNELPSRREVINLVDDSDDDAPPVLVASKPRAKMYKVMLPSWEVVVLVDNREPVAFFNLLSQAGVRCEWRRLATFDFLWVARRCSATNTTGCSSEDDGR